MKIKDIPMNNEFVLRVTARQYELRRRKVHDNPNRKEFGQEYSSSEGYATSLEQLIDMMVSKGCHDEDISTLHKLSTAKAKMVDSIKSRIIVALEEAINCNRNLSKCIASLERENKKLKEELNGRANDSTDGK